MMPGGRRSGRHPSAGWGNGIGGHHRHGLDDGGVPEPADLGTAPPGASGSWWPCPGDLPAPAPRFARLDARGCAADLGSRLSRRVSRPGRVSPTLARQHLLFCCTRLVGCSRGRCDDPLWASGGIGSLWAIRGPHGSRRDGARETGGVLTGKSAARAEATFRQRCG